MAKPYLVYCDGTVESGTGARLNMGNQEMPRRRRFSVWWGVVLGLPLRLLIFPVVALRASQALDIADPLVPGPTLTLTSY
ncbi:hypothetical protein [Rhodococcus erythropolis]|uniref:hypothetical protein n=1 Tax=Rhodococcus erythropolis TaxID=1833 RepID=UPI00210BDA0F|nr:hypothetical protein [Rhodococcus erythropolis]